MKNIIANRNGIGNAVSTWYFTGYDSQELAEKALIERKANAVDGWDAELLLVTAEEADELASN